MIHGFSLYRVTTFAVTMFVAAILHWHYHYVLHSGRDRGRRRCVEKEPAFTAYLYLLKA